MPYQTNPETGYVDYAKIEDHARLFRPNVLICGGSAYPRDWDYARLRKVWIVCVCVCCGGGGVSELVYACVGRSLGGWVCAWTDDHARLFRPSLLIYLRFLAR